MLHQVLHRWVKGRRPDDQSHRIFVREATTIGLTNLFLPNTILAMGIFAAIGILFVVEKQLFTSQIPSLMKSCRSRVKKSFFAGIYSKR